ncbi:MAG: sugar phosphate isomerase/epimerase [Verrucomicrobiales bacterium]|nr:sugar phosphate isomerase/epimerase [Verrucomicrobiales bacterium]
MSFSLSNRRAFLRRGLAGIGAGWAAWPGTGRSAEATAWKPRFSTSSLHFKDEPLEGVCDRVAGLGFEAIDVWSAYEGCRHLDDAMQRLGGQGLSDVLERAKLKLFAASTYVGGYRKYADFLGAAGGCVAVQGSAEPCPPTELVARMRKFLESMKPLADLAGERRSWLAIENHGHALLDGLDSFRAFVDLNTHPRLGIALAPYHLQALGASVPEAIRIAGRQLLFFYAWQKGEGLEQLPGHGTTDMKPWMKALGDAGYAGYVNVFMHGHPDAATMSAALSRSRAALIEPAPRSP